MTDRRRGGTSHALGWARRGDDGVALTLAVLLVVVVAALSLAVAGITVAQVKPTQLTRKTVRTVHAAEAGIDVALARIRAATVSGSDGTKGDPTKLPCANSGPALSGAVGTEQGELRYAVRIRYYDTDPSPQPESWRSTQRITCTYSGPTRVPAYALVESTGSGTDVPGTAPGTGDRVLETVYDFSLLKDENVAGGSIELGTTGFCMTAGAASASSPVRVAACTTGHSLQTWAYRSDLTLALVSSLSGSTPLCIDAQNKAEVDVQLQRCGSDPTSLARQRWSFNDHAHFEGYTAPTLNDHCIRIDGSSPVNNMKLRTARGACKPDTNSVAYWSPDRTIGAGQAGGTTGELTANGQLVSYEEFGRCLDVPAFNLNYEYLYLYPCKQSPNPQEISWNQRLAKGPNGTLVTKNDSRPGTPPYLEDRCLTAGTGTSLPVSGTRVLMRECTSSATQRWTFSGGNTTYASSYTITSAGLCLSVGPRGYKDPAYSTLVMETCDGSLRQKWNAPADLLPSTLRNTREINPADAPG